VSEEDQTQVAYFPTIRHFLEDRPVRTKPGKFLMKHYHTSAGGPLSDQDVKYWAEKQVEAHKPLTLNLVGNDDPDGWEWVYEHGTGFNSCMVRDRIGRYLDSACEDYHPVRAYATKHPSNHLALAWIGPVDKFKTSVDRCVAGRAIVNTKTMTYVRIYGDDRTSRALEDAGYRYDGYRTLNGQVMYAEHYSCEDYFLPYLDWGAYEWYDEVRSLVVVTDNGCDGESCGIVRMKERERCADCGDTVDTDNDSYVESANGYVCEHCLDRHYVYARTSRYDHDHIPTSDAVENLSTGEWVSEGYADNNLQQTEDGDWYHEGDVVQTPEGWYPANDCVSLARDYDGFGYAHTDNAKEVDGDWYHEDDDTSDLEEDAPLDFTPPALFATPRGNELTI
jgi:hypothetical protein